MYISGTLRGKKDLFSFTNPATNNPAEPAGTVCHPFGKSPTVQRATAPQH